MNLIGFLILMFLIVALSTPKSMEYIYPRTFWFSLKLDDTDDLIDRKPSGLILFIDHGTGVHYIKTPFGSLIPRLNKEGKIINEYQQEEESK